MKARLLALTFALLAAGCTAEEEPQESTEPTVDATPTPTPTQAEPTPPTDDGIGPVTSTVIPPAAPAPAPAPVPASDPAPAPEPAPAPAPEPAAPPPAPAQPTAAPPPPPPPPAPTPPPPPPPTPTPQPTTWPREGSHVTIEGHAGESVPNTYQNTSDWRATWVYRDGDWHGTCEGSWTFDWDDEEDDSRDRNGTFRATFEASDPPHWPLFNTRDPPDIGEQVLVWHMWDCDIHSRLMYYAGTVDTAEWGIMHNADNDEEAEQYYSDYDAWWDPETGLVMAWSWSRTNSGTGGRVTSTDAPIG